MVKENKTTIFISIVVVILFIIGVFATSYAYYTATIEKDNKNSNITDIETGSIGATFTDGEDISFDNMIPGDQFTKTFSLKNTGTVNINYKVVVRDVENTFKRPEDIEVIVKEAENIINTTIFPSTTNAISGTNAITIRPGETKSYTIIISYKNQPDIDQSSDMESKISGKIFIEEI